MHIQRNFVLRRLFSLLLMAAVVSSIAACRKPSVEKATASDPSKPAATSGQTPPPPAKPLPAQLPDVLARVNGEAVMKADFDRLIKNMELRANQPIPAERRDDLYRKALDELVTYTVLSQETRARKFNVTDADVDGSIQQMRSQFPSEDAFKKALEARGMSLDKLKADTRIDISINKMVEAEVSTQPPPSDAQIRDFYDKNPDKFKQDETVRASHILFKVDENADAATKKKAMDEAQSVLKQARGTSVFISRESRGMSASASTSSTIARSSRTPKDSLALTSLSSQSPPGCTGPRSPRPHTSWSSRVDINTIWMRCARSLPVI
jgi:peptidyl-prolyl cis-trans isomerase C